MEILEHGKYFENNTWVCRNCGCIFSYEPKDIQHINYRDGDIAKVLLICPECKEKNYLD